MNGININLSDLKAKSVKAMVNLDEKQVRLIVAEYLKSQGYEVNLEQMEVQYDQPDYEIKDFAGYAFPLEMKLGVQNEQA